MIFLAVYLAYKAIKSFYLSGKYYRSIQKEKTVEGGQTVKCDQCGAYVAEELSITVKKRGKRLSFCGTECKDAFDKE